MRRQNMTRNIPLFLSSSWNYGSCHQTEERSHENWVDVRKFHPSNPLLPSIISSEHSLRFSEQFQIIFFVTVYGKIWNKIYLSPDPSTFASTTPLTTYFITPPHYPLTSAPPLLHPCFYASHPRPSSPCPTISPLSSPFLPPRPPPAHTHTTIPSRFPPHCWPKSLLPNFIQNELIPNSDSEEGKVFYYKMKGDYHRYLAEVDNLFYETIVQ